MWRNFISAHHHFTESILNKKGSLGLLLFTLLVLFLSWYRLRFGVDFTDEAFYIAVPYRFALGDRLFIDELSLAPFAIFSIPFIKLHLWLQGDLDGVVLSMRQIYLCFTCGVAAVVCWSLTFFVRRKIAFLIALSFIVCPLGNIPNFSYNSLCSAFIILALFSTLAIVKTNAHFRYYLIPGLLFGFAIISYPPLILPVLFYAVVILPLDNTQRKQSIFAFLIGLALAGSLLIPALLQTGDDHLSTDLQWLSSVGAQGGGLQKVKTIVRSLFTSWPQPYLVLALIILVGITYYKHPFYCCLLLILLPVSFMPLRSFSPTTNMMFINHYCLLAPLIAMLTWQNKPVRQLFLIGWLPAFFMGLTTAWSSANGFRNASIGWIAGAIVTVVLITLTITELDQREKTVRRFGLRYLQSIPALMFVIFLLQSQFRSGAVYRDDNIPLLTSRVTSGPYQGMYTTPSKNGYLQTITRDINNVVGANQTILFYDLFPAGYLLSSARPATPAIWIQPLSRSPRTRRDLLVGYYQQHAMPDVVVQLLHVPEKTNTKPSITSLTYPEHDVFNNYIHAQSYQSLRVRKQYRIMGKQKRPIENK
jgi:hypothetical protein